MTAKKPVLSLEEQLHASRDSMHQRFLEAFNGVNEAFTPESLAPEITAMLTKERREIVLKLLGFDNRWGELEVDHCSAHNKDSIVGQYLRTTIAPIVQEWLENDIRPMFEAKARKTIANARVKAAIQKDFMERFNYHLREAISREAERLAKEQVQLFSAMVHKTMSLTCSE